MTPIRTALVWPEHPGLPQTLHIPPGWTQQQIDAALAVLRGEEVTV